MVWFGKLSFLIQTFVNKFIWHLESRIFLQLFRFRNIKQFGQSLSLNPKCPLLYFSVQNTTQLTGFQFPLLQFSFSLLNLNIFQTGNFSLTLNIYFTKRLLHWPPSTWVEISAFPDFPINLSALLIIVVAVVLNMPTKVDIKIQAIGN